MREEVIPSKLLVVLMSVIVVFYSGSAVSIISSQYKNSIVLVAILFLVLRILKQHYSVSKSLRTFFLIFFGVMMLINVVATTFSVFYLRLYATVYLAYELTEHIDRREFVTVYIKVMFYVTCVALIGYLLVNFFHIDGILPAFTNVNGEVYRGLFFFNFLERLPERNCALFWEPGLFATALTFALLFEFIYQREKNIFHIIIFFIGIVTAKSTAGYVMLALLLVLVSVHIQPKRKSLRILVAGLQIAIIIGAILAFFNLDKILIAFDLSQNEIFTKLMADTFTESQRGRAIQDSFSSFMDNPILGSGAVDITNSMSYIADTATSIYAMSVFGILGIGYSLFFILGILRQRKVGIMTRVILLVIVFGLLNKEPHLDLLFTWMFGFFLLKDEAKEII